jgi:hypothetical protein
MSNLTAVNGTDTRAINLPGNGVYKILVNITSVDSYGTPDTSRAGVARGDLVIPSIVGTEPVPEFGPAVYLVVLLGIVGSITIGRKFVLIL